MHVTIKTHGDQILLTLEELYLIAKNSWVEQTERGNVTWRINEKLRETLDTFWQKSSGNATSAITNLVTCLVCKAVEPNVDPRYYRSPEDPMPAPPAGRDYFSGRGISEKLVAPWLSEKKFITANSGWQTRTFERLNPYDLHYPENIAYIKEEFLGILDFSQANSTELTKEILVYLFYKQIERRDGQQFTLTIPRIQEIRTIVGFVESHFNFTYSQKGAARLPVLALYAIYQCIMPQTTRYKGDRELALLQRHEAADLRTGAIGDIEIYDAQHRVVEGVEVKYKIQINAEIIRLAFEKFRGLPTVQRYYILTTSEPCGGQDTASLELIRQIQAGHGAELIVNGVLPTIKYYLRLLENPAAFLPRYVDLLNSDQSIGYEHRRAWNDVVLNKM